VCEKSLVWCGLVWFGVVVSDVVAAPQGMEWNGRRDWREEKKRQVWCRPLGLSPSFLYSGVPPPARCWRSAAALRANSKSKQQHLPRSLSLSLVSILLHAHTHAYTRAVLAEKAAALSSLSSSSSCFAVAASSIVTTRAPPVSPRPPPPPHSGCSLVACWSRSPSRPFGRFFDTRRLWRWRWLLA